LCAWSLQPAVLPRIARSSLLGPSTYPNRLTVLYWGITQCDHLFPCLRALRNGDAIGIRIARGHGAAMCHHAFVRFLDGHHEAAGRKWTFRLTSSGTGKEAHSCRTLCNARIGWPDVAIVPGSM